MTIIEFECDWGSRHPATDRHTVQNLLEHVLHNQREERERDQKIMADLTNLAAIEAKTGADLAQLGTDLTAAIAALQATIDGLTVGAVTQAQIDDLATQAQAVDDAVNALDAGVKPPTP